MMLKKIIVRESASERGDATLASLDGGIYKGQTCRISNAGTRTAASSARYGFDIQISYIFIIR